MVWNDVKFCKMVPKTFTMELEPDRLNDAFLKPQQLQFLFQRFFSKFIYKRKVSAVVETMGKTHGCKYINLVWVSFHV